MKRQFNVDDKVTIIDDQPLKGNEIAPPVKVGEEHTIKGECFDKEGNQHLDLGLGLPCEVDYVTSYETKERLPQEGKIHWVHPSRLKKVIAVLIGVMITFISTAQCYNLGTYNEKKFFDFKREALPVEKWGGYLQMNGSYTPSHDGIFLGATAGVAYKWFEVSSSFYQHLANNPKLTTFNAMAGIRLPVTPLLITLTPKFGYWSYLEGNWIKGNHACYGIDMTRQTEGNIEYGINWTDYRKDPRGAMKTGTIFIRLKL